jgi:hypothetical protein
MGELPVGTLLVPDFGGRAGKVGMFGMRDCTPHASDNTATIVKNNKL